MDALNDRIMQAARSAVRQAGAIQLAGLSQTRQIRHKGTYDLVTDVDGECERAMLAILEQALPEAGILAEEGSPTEPDARDVWIVDPLDGTTNYAHGYPTFSAVVALRQAGEIVLGAVYDPLRDELFEARRGRGAQLNGQAIAVSQTRELAQSLLSTGFPYDRLEHNDTNLERFCALTMRTQGVRRGGSASLDLCYTACGRLDGYWEIRLHPWDICAGALIVAEAGGQISDMQGARCDLSGAEIVASNGRLHAALLAALG
ncbi:MAG TPA: inositol monophosphatase family protein [Myxococcota bacterium]|nr:inositol monophosphatase family protein [Myxococcota bacterium]